MISARSILPVLFAMLVASPVSAGEVSGIVVYKSGTPAKGIKVSGLTSGSFGGIVKAVSTDRRGNFCLTWTSNTGLAKLYVEGTTYLRNVKNKAKVRIVLKR